MPAKKKKKKTKEKKVDVQNKKDGQECVIYRRIPDKQDTQEYRRMTESLCSSDDEKKSLFLFNAIDALGLSKERREINKHIVWHTNLLSETFFKNQIQSFEIVGSNSEGLFHTVENKSDQDFLCLDKSITVLNSKDWVDRISQNAHTGLYFGAEPDQSFPGYVRLRIPDGSPIIGKKYFESKMYLDIKFDKYLMRQRCSDVKTVSSQINGPAITFEYDYGSHPISHIHLNSEYIHCLIYRYWPNEASHWIDRAKLSGWPAKEIVEKITSKGCTLAPVGHTDCCGKDEQWRIGIYGERILFEELNEIQIRCYFILKQILKEDLQNVCGDALSSYHMKNVIFWCAEQCTNNWTLSNFTKCVKLCLEQLEKFLESECLPHFFIEKRNLLNSKLSKPKRLNVIKALQTYRRNVMDVLELVSFKKLQTLINFDYVSMKSRSDKEIINTCFVFITQPYSYFYGAPIALWQRYNTHGTRECLEIFRDIYQTLMSDEKSFTVLHTLYVKNMLGLIHYSFYKSNGSREARLTAKKLTEESKCLPITTIQLRTATILYMENEFVSCMSICDEILKSRTKFKTLSERKHVHYLHSIIVKEIDKLHDLTDHTLIIKIKEVMLNLFYQRQNKKQTKLGSKESKFVWLFNNFTNLIFKDVHYPVFYMGSEKWAVPEVILYELLSLPSIEIINICGIVVRDTFIGMSVDPIFNCYLLQFLISLDTKDSTRANAIISDMKTYTDHQLSGPFTESQANKMNEEQAVQTLNILGYCCLKVKLDTEAAKYLCKSFKISTSQHNAAYGHILHILQSFALDSLVTSLWTGPCMKTDCNCNLNEID